MSMLRIVIRLTIISLHILVGILLCVFVLPTNWNKPNLNRQRNIVRWWLYTCARIIGIRIQTHGKTTKGASLVVSNHISWLDILVVGGLQPVSFLSKAEISYWPIIGYLARKSGTLFIDRGSGAKAVAQAINDRLHTGAKVAFFPEGTTSDGTLVRRFHPRLFMSSIETSTPVQPIFITYLHSDSDDSTVTIHPKVPYTGDIPFFIHALAIMGEPYIRTVVHYTDTLSSNVDRKELAEKAHELIDDCRALQKQTR